MIILGAGMAGLLAAAINPGSTIYEAKPEGSSAHKALFRCRSNEIGHYTGIEFKKVQVTKAIWFNGREANITPRLANMYSYKVTGKIEPRSILNVAQETRWIPPIDFFEQLKKRANATIHYEHPINDVGDIYKITNKLEQPLISTLPMPILAQIIKADRRGVEAPSKFDTRPIYVTKFKIENCNAYQTIYYPSLDTPVYRASLSGDRLIIESTREIGPEGVGVFDVFESFGIEQKNIFPRTLTEENYVQKFGKVYPCDEIARRNFITATTLQLNIFSLGRFATWRPKVMLDDVLNDIFVIRKLLAGGIYSIYKSK